ncbi:phosphatase PAP2 family protein [Leucobacter coleopterorum]|uniref:Phosphatase PAP2 family protein n=1 Tax=Leucobacter coleopterorum TaxID=2714933 RepID=A0ABX6JUZ2_9MICO|nr:phosphatase PAP2 family protein [Leucobacter coleopterorum]QIM18118.1 phosphatase PAP2 family protein [Leucobacter coleopterorum]
MSAKLPRTLPWVLVGLFLFTALAVYLRFIDGGPFGIDSWWYNTAEVSRGSGVYAVAVFMAQIGGGVGSVACTAVAVALLLVMRRPRDAAALATAMILGIAGSELTKHLVLRPRPWDQLYDSSGSSFPSGHTMGAAALAISLVLMVAGSESMSKSLSRGVWVIAVVWVITMAWSRTALHVHWLSDTLAGALLGVCAAIIARRIWFRQEQRENSAASITNVRPTA